MTLGILEILKTNEINADYLTGLSLGEYPALIYANSFSFEDGIKIINKRGELMQDNLPSGDWLMAAILGLDDSKVNEICKSINLGFVVPSNYNCPGQVVISGEKVAVHNAIQKAKESGCKRAIPLKTSGPFHTEKLQIASSKFRTELKKYNISNPQKVVIKNIDATEYTTSDDIIDILSKHITNSVRFGDCIKKMLSLGVDTFIEIGPGKALSSFIKKINSDVNILNINDKESLENTIEFVKKICKKERRSNRL